MTIWEFNTRLTRRLLAWGLFSVVAGLRWLWQRDPYWQGVGIQFAAWGAIDGLIAGVGGWQSRRRYRQAADPNATAVQAQETRNLRRLLWINTGLDVFYVLGGAWLARRRGAEDARWRGHGHGIMVQGAFLFVFDLIHVLIMPGSAVDDDAAQEG